MFTFLIVVKILILPTQEVHEFKVWSTEQSSQSTCSVRAAELSEYISEFVQEHMPAKVMTQPACVLQPTRQT